MRLSGNVNIDKERQIREDPMARFVSSKQREREEKYERVELLKRLVDEIREEERERKRRKEEKRLLKKEKKKHKKEHK